MKKLISSLLALLLSATFVYADVVTKNPIIQDEGVTQGAARTTNYVGDGITATVSSGISTVTVDTSSVSGWTHSAPSIYPTTITDNVGIATTSPLGLLQVGTSPTPGLIVLPSGYVGIGTTVPIRGLYISKEEDGDTFNTAYIYNTSAGGSAVSQFIAANNVTEFAVGLHGENHTLYPNLAFLWGGDNPLGFFTSDTERMRITSGGNVGIGTTLPLGLLQVGTSPNAPLVVLAGGNVGIGRSNPSAKLHIFGAGTGTGFALRIADSTSTDRLVVMDNGNAGIGTTGPGYKLDVNGTGRFADDVLWDTNKAVVFRTSARNYIYSNATDELSFFTGAVEHLHFKAGNVGIGTTLPLGLLQVGTSPKPGLLVTPAGNVGIGTTGTPCTLTVTPKTDSSTVFQVTNATNTALFKVDTSNGYIMVGTPSSGSYPIEVTNAPYTHGTAHAQIIARDTTAVAQGVGGGIGFLGKVNTTDYGFYAAINAYKSNATADNYSGQLHFQTRKDGASSATRMIIDENGNMGIGTTSPTGLLHIGSQSVAPLFVSSLTGNVGIGTTAPTAKLEIVPASTAPAQGLYINFAGGPIVMKSPDGTCGKCTLANDETFGCVSVTCP